MNILIIDSDLWSQKKLTYLLKMHKANIHIPKSIKNSEGIKNDILSKKIDIVFAEIHFDSNDIFDLIKGIHTNIPLFIILTDTDKYALKAIKYEIFDYILKPIDQTILSNTLDKAKIRLNYRKALQINDNPIKNRNLVMGIPSDTEITIIFFAEIKFLKSHKSGTIFYLGSNTIMNSPLSIDTYEKILNDTLFLRVHQSYIVNIFNIESIVVNRGRYDFLITCNNITIPINQKYAKVLFNFIKNKIYI